MSHEPIKPLFEDATAPSELRNFVTLARNDGASQADLDRLAKRVAPMLGVSAAFMATSAAAVGTTAPLAAPSSFGAPASGLTPALGAASVAKMGAGVGAGAGAVSAAKVGLFGQLMASASAKLLAVSLSVGAAGLAVYSATHSEPSAGGPQARTASAHTVAHAVLPRESAAVSHGEGTAAPVLAESPLPAAGAAPREAASVAQPISARAPEGALRPPDEARSQNADLLPRAVRSAPLARRAARAPRATTSAPGQAEPREPPASEFCSRAEPRASTFCSRAEPRASTPAITDQPVAQAPDAKPSLPPPSELSLIERAEAARARPGEALAFLAKHEEVYPRGALAQEREVLAVELLLKAGKVDQGEARAERFEDAYPRSAHLPHLRALLTRANAR